MTNNTLQAIQDAIKNQRHFVLQGGAGSGKTETLKEVIEFIAREYPTKKVVCITHTNNAVDEIKARIGYQFNVSTIHSFLHDTIKNYPKNIKEIIHHIFEVKLMDESIADEKKYDTYKKTYEKYTKRRFIVEKQSSPKVIAKREFDKNTSEYIKKLNAEINRLNEEIKTTINERNSDSIQYNNTRFDRFSDLSYGHDSLLKISSLLINKYPLLSKIIRDKYDFILIDEYQDTNKIIINMFFEKIAVSEKTTIGLFGDPMQAIYDDGVGDVQQKINDQILVKINKEDNFRCSQAVVNFINHIRTDEINQKIALKKINGVDETLADRTGKVQFYYKIYNKPKPNVRSSQEEKECYLTELNNFIKEIKNDDYKVLMLTNKSIAVELKFENLYNIFSDRFTEVKNEIEDEFSKLQFTDLLKLYTDYKESNYNSVLCEIKKSGFKLNTSKDKLMVKKIFDSLSDLELGAFAALEHAFNNKIMLKSDQYAAYINRKDVFLNDLKKDQSYQNLKSLYRSGCKTYTQLKNKLNVDSLSFSQEDFDSLQAKIKKDNFYHDLFSDCLKFVELVNYYKYSKEETKYLTMHKTKGSGIENVMVVLDEYFWNNYNFQDLYIKDDNDIVIESSSKGDKILKSKKLFYVACSRAIKNLTIIRLVEDQKEATALCNYFSVLESETSGIYLINP